MLTSRQRDTLREGIVIPAHPLALTKDLELDVQRQRGLTRHYLDAGSGGLAVGVHTTQFEIHDPDTDWYPRVLGLAAEEAREWAGPTAAEPILVAGILGPTPRATSEAGLARDLGYNAGLVAMKGWGDAPEEQVLQGIAQIGERLPIVGFYLQHAIGKRRFGYDFWRRFVDIDAVVAIKIAPFDRYATWDVVRAVVDSGRADSIALYTGNDDSIVSDLITPFTYRGTTVHIVGGLLGQWAVGTQAAVAIHREIRRLVTRGEPIPQRILEQGARLTDLNSAIFDVANGFTGSIAGINELLARQGLLRGNWCLAAHERLSPGQSDELDRVLAEYRELL